MFSLGKKGVSRPIEGLNSCGAVVSLRGRGPLIRSANALRPRVDAPRVSANSHSRDRRINVDKREADLFARRCVICGVRAAPRLSRPSMGRDTLLYPINKSRQRQGGQGLGSQASRIVAGIRFPVMASCRAPGPLALRGAILGGRPRNPQPSRLGFRCPRAGEPSPCPSCRSRRRPRDTRRAAPGHSAAGIQRQSCHCTIMFYRFTISFC